MSKKNLVLDNRSEDHVRIHCPSGSKYENKFQIKIDDFGHKNLVKTGEQTNVYELIQAHRDSVDIAKIIERIEVDGIEVLNRKEALTGDATCVPHSMLEAAQLMEDIKTDFNNLPLETRKKFNFDVNQYIAQASNDPKLWAQTMGYIEPNINPIPETPIETPTEPISDQKGGEE